MFPAIAHLRFELLLGCALEHIKQCRCDFVSRHRSLDERAATPRVWKTSGIMAARCHPRGVQPNSILPQPSQALRTLAQHSFSSINLLLTPSILQYSETYHRPQCTTRPSWDCLQEGRTVMPTAFAVARSRSALGMRQRSHCTHPQPLLLPYGPHLLIYDWCGVPVG